MKTLLLALLLPSIVFAQGIVPPTSSGGVDLTKSVDSTVASGGRSFSLLQGARLMFDGTTGAKYLSSDGTTLTATGLSFSASKLTSTASASSGAVVTTQGAYYCFDGATCNIRMYYDGSVWHYNLSGTDAVTVTTATGISAFPFGISMGSGIFAIPTTDSSGTPGAATINKIAGRVAIAASASTVVVTNSKVTAASHVFISAFDSTFDGTCTKFHVTPTAGSFTITADAACTGNTKLDFLVTN